MSRSGWSDGAEGRFSGWARAFGRHLFDEALERARRFRFEKILAVNVTGYFLISKAVAQHMEKHAGGAIVLTTSGVIRLDALVCGEWPRRTLKTQRAGTHLAFSSTSKA